MIQMKFSVKRRAGLVNEALEQAVQMCEGEHGTSLDDLWVSEAVVGRGSYTPKVSFRARGKFAALASSLFFFLALLAPMSNRMLLYFRCALPAGRVDMLRKPKARLMLRVRNIDSMPPKKQRKKRYRGKRNPWDPPRPRR